jgi:hypothetical protein
MNARFYLLALVIAPGLAIGQVYNGPSVDINHIKTPPAKFKFCDRHINSSAKVYRACELGLSEAERMAIRYGGGHGKLEGFLTGFTWGLHERARLSRDDENSMAEGAATISDSSIGATMEAGIREGMAEARRHALPRGEQDARQEFINALDNSNATLQAEPIVPSVSYNGITDAYQKLVGPVKTDQQIIEQEVDLYQLPVEYSTDAVYLGEVRPLSIWDYFSYNGVYRFEKDKWYVPGKAWEVWLNVLNLDTKAEYLNLNIDQPTDENGVIITDLQAVFKEAFVQSYGYYINHHFSNNFHSQLGYGQVAGENIGTQVGKRIAFHKGLVQAYNQKFKESSKQRYLEEYATAYKQGYSEVFDFYSNNPVLELSIVEIIGESDNGVIEPSEKVAFKLEIKNYGNVSSSLDIGVSGDIEESTSESVSINALSSAVVTTGMLATIDSRLDSRDSASLLVSIAGINGSTAQASTSQTVNNVVQIAQLDDRLDINSGKGTIGLTVENTTTLMTPGQVSAELRLDGKSVETVSAGKLQAGSEKMVSLQFSKVDPLSMILSSVNAEVVISLNGVEVESKTISLKASDREQAIIDYLDGLLGKSALVPSGVSASTRLNDITSKILELNSREVRDIKSGRNLYKKNPTQTIPGKLAIKAEASNTQDKKVHYHNMAVNMYKERKVFGWLSGKKGKMRKLLDRMTINKKVKKAKLK